MQMSIGDAVDQHDPSQFSDAIPSKKSDAFEGQPAHRANIFLNVTLIEDAISVAPTLQAYLQNSLPDVVAK